MIPGSRAGRSYRRIAAVLLALCAAPGWTAGAQALTGMSGLVSIPTAAVQEDASVTAGISTIDRRYTDYVNPNLTDRRAVAEYVSVGFLPFLEVGLRFTRVQSPARQALGDRMVSARLRLVGEHGYLPAIAVGAQDVVGTRYFHSTYVVASKRLALAQAGTADVSLGFGGNWLRIRARGEQFSGVFGGVEVRPASRLGLLAEYDAKRVNVGVRMRVWRFTVTGAAEHMDGLSGGVSYTQPLHR